MGVHIKDTVLLMKCQQHVSSLAISVVLFYVLSQREYIPWLCYTCSDVLSGMEIRSMGPP